MEFLGPDGRPGLGALVHGFDQGLQDEAMKTSIVDVGVAAAAAAGAGWYFV
jgi:hypothetical protein